MFHKILVATDGSENALRAARFALELWRLQPEAKVALIHVYSVTPYTSVPPEAPFLPSLEKFIEEKSRQILDNTAKILQEAGVKVETITAEGEPGRVICDYAKKHGYDHIVIGARGSGLAELLFGSVAEKVVHLASCPVAVVK
ncbi:MAG: universal stress protein [Peptococcaceae bacterium]|nr:universal stress protein [Peptococcaceae bacterium]